MAVLEYVFSVNGLLLCLVLEIVLHQHQPDLRISRFRKVCRRQEDLSRKFLHALSHFNHGQALKLLNDGANADSVDERGRHALCIAIETTENSTDLSLIRTMMEKSTQLRSTASPPSRLSTGNTLKALERLIIPVLVYRNLGFLIQLPMLLLWPLSILTPWDQSYWKPHLQISTGSSIPQLSLPLILTIRSLTNISGLMSRYTGITAAGNHLLGVFRNVRYLGPIFGFLVLPLLNSFSARLFYATSFKLISTMKTLAQLYFPTIIILLNTPIGHTTGFLASVFLELLVLRSDVPPREPVYSSVLRAALENTNASAQEIMLLILEQVPYFKDRATHNSEFCRIWTYASSRGFHKILRELHEVLTPGKESDQELLYSALSTAVERCDIVETRWLLQHGAEVQSSRRIAHSPHQPPPVPLAIQWAWTAVGEDHRLMLGILANHSLDTSAISPHSGRTALSIICELGDKLDFATPLFDAGADSTLHAADFNGRTALHHAARTGSGSSRVIRLLVGKGARVEALDNDGHTALWWAAHLGNSSNVAALIEVVHESNVSVDFARKDTSTPLLDSCQYSSVAIVRQLLSAGADVNAVLGDRTPLLAALDIPNSSIEGNELIETLLAKGASPLLSPDANRQPLVKAAEKYGGDKWVGMILAACIDPVPKYILNRAFQTSCYNARYEAVLSLLSAGAEATSIFNKGTALHCICHGRRAKLKQTVINALLLRGVNVDAVNESDQTALHIASQKGDKEAICCLLDNGAMVDALDSFGRSPLHLASRVEGCNWSNIISLSEGLNEAEFHGVRGNYRRDHIWMRRFDEFDQVQRYAGVIQTLLSRGSDPFRPDSSGSTAVHYASLFDNDVAVKVIIDHVIQLRPQTFNRSYLLPKNFQDPQRAFSRRGFPVLALIWMRNGEGRAPLHIAIERGHARVIKMLLKADCSRDVGGSRLITLFARKYFPLKGRSDLEWLDDLEESMKKLHTYASDLEKTATITFRSSSTSVGGIYIPVATVLLRPDFISPRTRSPFSRYEAEIWAIIATEVADYINLTSKTGTAHVPSGKVNPTEGTAIEHFAQRLKLRFDADVKYPSLAQKYPTISFKKSAVKPLAMFDNWKVQLLRVYYVLVGVAVANFIWVLYS